MNKNKYNNKLHLRHAFIVVTIFGIALLALFVLEKTGVTNFYQQAPAPVVTDNSVLTGEVPSAKPTNTVDYSPPKSDETSMVPDKSTATDSQPKPMNTDLSITMTRSFKSGDQYIIKAVIYGTDSATCRATMAKDSLNASRESGAVMIEGQYSCKDLSIPMSQLRESGEWNLELIVTDKNGATAASSEKVIL